MMTNPRMIICFFFPSFIYSVGFFLTDLGLLERLASSRLQARLVCMGLCRRLEITSKQERDYFS